MNVPGFLIAQTLAAIGAALFFRWLLKEYDGAEPYV